LWLAALGTGIGAGLSAIVLTRLLEMVQHAVWAGSGTHILDAAARAGAWRHVIVLLGAGVVVGIGQLVLVRLSDEQRRLLVACGAGAGMAAAYGVPLGGALFALEVLRGMLALRLILPALLASLVATTDSWIFLPNAPTYQIPAYSSAGGALALALTIGPIAGLVAVGYVRRWPGPIAESPPAGCRNQRHPGPAVDRTTFDLRRTPYRRGSQGPASGA
jgi:hypothetical protein